MNAVLHRLDRISGPLFAALGLANALFLWAFLVVLFVALRSLPAAAAETCTGENVLDAMKRDDPAGYERVMKQAAETLNGDTRLFRIEKDGLPASYLFGTMHLTDERVIDLPQKAQAAFDEAGTVAIESTEILDQAKMAMSLFARPELTMFTGQEDLSDYLTDDQRELLKEGLAKRGIQFALVERMKPWLLTGMVALPPCELDRKQAGASFLDLKLAEDAERDGKELVGLETVVEQLDAMVSLPMSFHVQGLVESIALGDRIDDIIETMIQLYVKGETGAIWPMLHSVSPEMETNEELAAGYADFEETMVHVRNKTMLDRAMPLLDKGGAFVAVGALHLPGEKGLAHLIDEAGYTVTPVYE